MTSAASIAPRGAARPPMHEAVVAASAAEHADLVASRVEAAVAAGEQVLAVLDGALRRELGARLGVAADAVDWVDPAHLHLVPAFTVAKQIARLGRSAAAAGTRAMLVHQDASGLPGCGGTYWARLEIALNVLVADLPLDVLCLYRSDMSDVELTHLTHPHVSSAGGRRDSTGFREPATALIDYPPPPAPDLGRPDVRMEFGPHDLGAVRRAVAKAGEDAGVDPDRLDDVVLSVSELATNSIEHGGGHGVLQAWHDTGGARLVVEVSDPGGGMPNSFPGLTLPPSDGVRGRGLWLVAELCDVLEVWPDERSTMVRVAIH